MEDEVEAEVETTLVVNKRTKLRALNGQLITAQLKVYECEEPYVLVFLVDVDLSFGIRTDIQKDELARELRLWLEGKPIRFPAVLISRRIEEAMNKFVKFGKTPLQEDLIMWILSRCEMELGDESELVFGGRGSDLDGTDLFDLPPETADNPFQKTVVASLTGQTQDPHQYRIDAALGQAKTLEFSMPKGIDADGRTMRYGEDQGMFSQTNQLLGRSRTLETVARQKTKGRQGATATMSVGKWSSEQLRLVRDINFERKKITQAMDSRRRTLEVAKIRQVQSAERYRQIQELLKEQQGGNRFVATAMEELRALQQVEQQVDEDTKKQRNQAQRGSQKVAWVMAPNGYVNRRGTCKKGPVLGPGPLPPNATSSLKDPKVERSTKRFYWDEAGRRHFKTGLEGDTGESVVERAMEAIRKAAANISSFKLDLKQIFDQFDTSGDGLLSPEEMAEAFLSMGVKLDIHSMNAIYKHFDPNDSGGVHYGEFIWAFFNRRSLVRQWKRKTDSLTPAQVTEKFHQADKNGNGRLSPKEFKGLLKSFGIELGLPDIEVLIGRFDVDNDGDIDMHEFRNFIEQEKGALFGQAAGATAPQLELPPPLNRSRARQRSRPQGSNERQNATQPLPLKPPPPTTNTSTSVEQPRDARAKTAPAPIDRGTWTESGERESSRSGGGEGGLEVDAMWLSRMMQAQAEIESRVGRRYYQNQC